MHAFVFLLLLTSCFKKTDNRTHVTPQQLNVLMSPKAGSTVEFDENGTRTIYSVGGVFIETVMTQDNKGGMYYDGGTSFHREMATAYYSAAGVAKASLYANSEDPYRTEAYPFEQGIQIGPSTFAINFSNKLASKNINGITYTDIVLGIDPYRNDTLFWKKNIGILGWKRADENYTAYRVF